MEVHHRARLLDQLLHAEATQWRWRRRHWHRRGSLGLQLLATVSNDLTSIQPPSPHRGKGIFSFGSKQQPPVLKAAAALSSRVFHIIQPSTGQILSPTNVCLPSLAHFVYSHLQRRLRRRRRYPGGSGRSFQREKRVHSGCSPDLHPFPSLHDHTLPRRHHHV